MGVDHHKSTTCMQYVVYNVWPVVYRKWSMSCFTIAGFVLHRWAMHEQQTTVIKPKFWDITLACDDNRNIHTHTVILVAMGHVHEGFKERTNIHTLLSTLEGGSAPSASGPQKKVIHGIISCLWYRLLIPTNPSMVKSHLTYLWWINFPWNIDYIPHK